jgi:hypothetical protein
MHQNVLLIIGVLCLVCFLGISIAVKGRGLRHQGPARLEDIELGPATTGGKAGLPKGAPPAGLKTNLWLAFAFLISLVALVPSLYTVFFAEANHPGREFATGLVGTVLGFWTGKGPDLVRGA